MVADKNALDYRGIRVGYEEVFPETANFDEKLAYNIVKRIFDVVCSLAALAVVLIPGIFIAAAIMIIDPGNPFFAQTRIGKDGNNIKIYKFRSMIKNADDLKNVLTPEQYEEYIKEFKLENDPRLLPHGLGKFIRCTSIDELPQLFNILKGDMSIVGPRPILRDELEEMYTVPEQRQLLSVKPGLTGYWQAFARNRIGYEDHKRQRMELKYIKNRSVRFDLKIIFRTISSVLNQKGAV